MCDVQVNAWVRDVLCDVLEDSCYDNLTVLITFIAVSYV